MSTDAFVEEYSQLTGLYLEGRFGDAIALTKALEGHHPERTGDIRHARACLYAAADRPADALSTMQSVVEAGSWWPPDRLEDPDLDPIRGDDRYTALAEAMRARHDRAVQQAMNSQVHVDVLGATSVSDAAIVALHMHGATGSETSAKWEAVSNDRVAIAVPESPLRNGDGRPCWNDDDVADRTVKETVRLLGDRAGADVPILLAGASQGARHAGRIAFTSLVPSCVGSLCIVGAPTIDEVDNGLPLPDGRGVRMAFIGEELDRLTLPRQQAVHEHLTQVGIASELIVIDGLGHAYPDNFADVFEHVLAFLLRSQDADSIR